MKRVKWIALLAIVLAALLPCAALAAPGDVNIGRDDDMREKYQDYVYGGCVSGDALCLYGSSHFFLYHIGDADFTAVEFEVPEAGESEYRHLERLFSDGETLYALCTVMYSGEDEYSLRSVQAYPIEIGADEAIFGEPVELSTDDLSVSYGGDESYFIQVNASVCTGGYLMLYVYNEMGEEGVYALNLASGEGTFVEDLGRVQGISAYADGQLLVASYSYNNGNYEYTFLVYDPKTDSVSPIGAPVEMDGYINGLVYSEESGRLFYLNGGYVMAVQDFDFDTAKPVAELSTLYYSDTSGMLLPGDYYVYASYDGTYIRSTDPDALPEQRLVVRGNGYSESLMSAYYAFGNTHGDVAVVLNQNYMPASALIENMMSRDDSVDIYMLSVSSDAYDALYNRGYMVELDNEEIVSAVEEMYPAIRDVLTRDGEVVAIPLSLYGWTMGLDYEGFEKIGIAREDVPDNWMDLLELLEELPERLPEDGSVRVFAEYYTQDGMRSSFFGNILESWRLHQSATGREISYNEPELIELFERIMDLDYEALGLPEENDDDEYYVISYSDDVDRTYQLIELSTGCTIGNFYSNAEPALMSVVRGEPGEVPLQLTVAFVNPFSRNVDLAQEFLAELLNDMDMQVAYNVSDKLNEPVRDTYTEEALAEYGEQLAQLQADLETAEAVDVPDIEEEIAMTEQILEDIDRYGWRIPQRDIDWYRAHAEYLAVERYDFLYAADDDGELSDLAEQFLAGRVSAADLLKEIDRKVRMRALEGN